MRFPQVTPAVNFHKRRGLSRALPAMAAGAVVLALGAALSGCIIGGTGTDTENGVVKNVPDKNPSHSISMGLTARVLDTAGQPLAGVLLMAFDPSFRPDSTNSPIANALIPGDTSKTQVVSDVNGKADFVVPAAGTYILEGSLNGKAVFFDTLRVVDVKRKDSVTYQARQLRAFEGKVKLASGMHIDSGKVFIRGTRHAVAVDSQGYYDLGPLPVNVVNMALGLRFSASPTSVFEVDQTVVKRDTTQVEGAPMVSMKDSLQVVYTCADLSADSAAGIVNPAKAIGSDSTDVDSGRTAVAALTSQDSSRVIAALRSCDSIPRGAVVNVKSVSAAGSSWISDTVTNRYSEAAATGVYLVSTEGGQIVSYGQCVQGPGTVKTSYALRLDETSATGDLMVSDLTGTCAQP